MTGEPIRRVSPEEYLAMEEASERAIELIDGLAMARPDNDYSHASLVRNLVVELDRRLRGKSREIVCSRLRVKVERTGDYFYPDLVGICGIPMFDEPNQVTLLNPTLLIEIMSPCSEGHDRGEKFLHYQQIPTLREYALISQEAARVELYTRGENSAWIYKVFAGSESTVSFASIDCGVPLADIYRDVGLGKQSS
jgi:Uma2 family endonuclease